ncbi:MAG: NADH-quinone oxidoreductase subunit L [Planctomycetota bacterium]|nr:MAG: NADH-quinone oxidoreductase subunit L [Planctomycetota bacterium]
MHIYLMLAMLLLPLAGFVIQIFFGRKLPRQGDWLPTTMIGISMLIGIGLFAHTMVLGDPSLLLHSGFENSHGESFSWNWLLGSATEFSRATLDTEGIAGNWVFTILFDNLTAVMLSVVGIVSFLVHVYSLGYMKGEVRYPRFFAYLGIFSFSMLGLVLSGNLLFLFLFWELVGFSSYLLIGFYFERDSAANACKKAFLVNKVGDTGLFIGMMILWQQTGSFDILVIFERISQAVAENGGVVPTWVYAAGLLLFAGPISKSAQFPLHVWLPDAMEGPTPVSALIHAATMVAAGVYLIARMFPMYLFIPEVLLVIAIFGAFTAIFAATIGLTQWDIKKVLAYSTVSQLGFMTAALGCGALAAGSMHLMTHAWFKAGLFLCSGSVIHGMHHIQDMREMGGLRKKMPVTYITMLLCTMAIAGVPFFSGFYSKDAIIAATLHPSPAYAQLGYEAHGFLWSLPSILIPAAAFMTAFYMFRLIILTFHGEPRSEHAEHAHESPKSMLFALSLLAALGVFGASPWIFNGDFLGAHIWFNGLIGNPVLSEAGGVVVPAEVAHHPHGLAPILISLLVAGGGILLAFMVYQWKKLDPAKIAGAFGPAYQACYDKYYVDEFISAAIVRPLVFSWNVWCAAFDKYVIDGIVNGVGQVTKLGSVISGFFDRGIIDGLVNALAFVTQVLGAIARIFQTGYLQHYLSMLVGGVTIAYVLFYFAF